MRGHIPQLSGPKAEGFIHNALQYATASFPFNPSTSLAEIAWQNRQAINECFDEKEIARGIGIGREAVRRGQSQHICDPFHRSYHVTNWCKAWNDVDLSAAVKEDAREGGEGNKLKMLVLGETGERTTPRRCKFTSTVNSGSCRRQNTDM